MGDLPWLVVHGVAFWQGALAAAAGTGFVWGGARAVAAARSDARRAREAMGRPSALAGVADGVTVTVEGTFTARAPLDQIPGELTPLGRWPGDPAVMVEGTRVALEGLVAIAAGSREARTGRGSPSHWDDRPWSPSLREIRPGDRVLARGVLRSRAGASGGLGALGTLGAQGYRASAAVEPVLEATAGVPVTLACAAAPGVRGPSLGRRVLAAAVWLAACTLTLWAVGRAAMWTARSRSVLAAPAMVLASAMPFQRADALRLLETRALALPPGPSVAPRRVALAMLQGHCLGAIEAAMEHGDLALAARVAHGCGRYRAEGLAWYGAGEFARASEALGRVTVDLPDRGELFFEADVHLLAGAYVQAAGNIERLASVTEARGHDWLLEPTLSTATAVQVRTLRCVADALRTRVGDRDARARLEAAALLGNSVCAVVWADAQPPGTEARAQALANPVLEGSRDRLVRLLRAENRPDAEAMELEDPGTLPSWQAADNPVNLVLRPYTVLEGQAPGLERAVLERLTRPSGLRVHLAQRAAVWDLLAGQDDAARADVALGRADVTEAAARHAPWSFEASRRGLGLLQAMRFRQGASPQGPAVEEDSQRYLMLDALASFTHGGSVENVINWVAESAMDWNPRDAEGWRAAATDDGVRLVAAAQELNATDETAPWMYLGVRRMVRGRTALAHWVHWGAVPRVWDRPALARLAAVANRREIAAALGDRALTVELGAVQARYAAALRRRDVAVVRAVLAGP